jgi:chromosome segregation ATPase
MQHQYRIIALCTLSAVWTVGYVCSHPAIGRTGGVMAQRYPNNSNYNNNNNNNNSNTNNNNSPPPPPPNTAAIDAAQKQVNEAQKAVNDAQAAFDKVVRPLRQAFNESPEMTAAQAALKDAQGAHDAAIADFNTSLAGNADYQAALKKKADAVQNLQSLKDAGAPQDQIATAAMDSLDAGSAAGKIRSAAEQADPKLAQTRDDLNAADAKVADLKKQFEQSFRTNPDIAAAKKTVDDAKTKLTTAENALVSAESGH